MSHYRVAVFSYNPDGFDDLLAPYGEQDEAYFKFVSPDGLEDRVKDYYNDYNKKYPNDLTWEEYLKDNGYFYSYGKLGYMANPEGYWDWYTLDGGDWQFPLKKGEHLDANGNGRKNQYQYYIKNDKGKTELDYPYAFITPDGEWHAPGVVGWFAFSDDTEESRKAYVDDWKKWIELTEENPYVCFVDCHI